MSDRASKPPNITPEVFVGEYRYPPAPTCNHAWDIDADNIARCLRCGRPMSAHTPPRRA